VFLQQKETHKEDCRMDDVEGVRTFTTDVAPTVVRARDVATASIQIKGEEFPIDDLPKEESERLQFHVMEGTEKNEKIPIEICYQISFATPADANDVAQLSLVKYQAAVAVGGPGIEIRLGEMRLGNVRPRQMIKRAYTVFSD
jgi:hypothetical protein